MFSTAAKVEVLQSEAKLVQNEEVVNNIFGNFGLMGMIEGIHLNLDIRRENILDDALTQLSQKQRSLRKPLRVKFVGEQGIDEGGVRKEFFHLLIEELFNPNYAMFLPKNVIFRKFMFF
jgi:ubiquitin-protein ligase E3 A